MNIGIDVDGILTYLEEFQLKYGKKHFKKDPVNENAYDIIDIFDCSKAEREKFWLLYIWKYCITESPRMLSKEVIKNLRDEGNRIYIITGRAHTTEAGVIGKIFRFMLTNWLRNNGIEYDEIVFCDEKDSARDKLLACQKYNINVMLEDKPDNIVALKDITNVICLETKYNIGCEGENITRVPGFEKAYDVIKELQVNQKKILKGGKMAYANQ